MNNLFLKSLYVFIITEILSLLTFLYFPNVPVVFFIIIILIAILSLYQLEYGLYIILAELFIGGKGYLFSLDIGNITISIRIALFVIIFGVWLYKKLRPFITHTPSTSPFERGRKIVFGQSIIWKYFYILFVLISYGIINGYFRNSLGNVFLDANAWIFFLLIFIFLDSIKKENIQNILALLFASVVWIGIKTAYILFLFSRDFSFIGDPIYKWIRNTGVGEITSMGEGMYRVFFQSHVYSLIAAIIILSLLFLGQKFDKTLHTRSRPTTVILSAARRIPLLIRGILPPQTQGQDDKSSNQTIWMGGGVAVLAFYFSALSIIISQSRSFWVGGVATFVCLFVYSIFFIRSSLPPRSSGGNVGGSVSNIKKILIFAVLFFIIIYSQLSVIKIITGNYGNLFAARLENSEEEAAGSSRMNQLQPLFDGIKKHPIFGSGFGTELTYKSNDPRVLTAYPDGMYTTYAFEWGYLDIWLKIGLVGLGIYLAILFFISKQLLLNNNIIQKSLFFGLLALMATNIFSPYLNHPLGIGYILLLSGLVYNGDMRK